uniref:Uncharacterized protein n=1 Tax=Asparagus officinalis TaxID=4686 RepID=Q2XNS6_ASPOF|nr:hypothetical protein 9.t00009 [Asparagus officinalis]
MENMQIKFERTLDELITLNEKLEDDPQEPISRSLRYSKIQKAPNSAHQIVTFIDLRESLQIIAFWKSSDYNFYHRSLMGDQLSVMIFRQPTIFKWNSRRRLILISLRPTVAEEEAIA